MLGEAGGARLDLRGIDAGADAAGATDGGLVGRGEMLLLAFPAATLSPLPATLGEALAPGR
jgi:hypothetical protein